MNEPPAFDSGAETYTIKEGARIESGNQYVASDPDDDDDMAILTWSLSGPDRSKFGITAGKLTFMTDFTPDYEMSVDADMDNVYEVTVVATVAGRSGTRDVRVTVENAEETGAVTLNRTTPRVGLPVTATLTDPDGSISGLTWQWSINDSPDSTPTGDIEGATSDTYVPKAGDVGGTLTATAMYDDGHSSEGLAKKTAMVAAVAVAKDTRNKPPVFVDQDADMDGVQNTTAERKVDENTGALADDEVEDNTADNVGSAVTADDPDPNTDPLVYTLSGADAGLFRVRRDNTTTQNANEGGQIEVASGTELDYEDRSSYEVTLTAEDSFAASASIMVTIMVTDVDEAPVMTGDAAIEYEENGTGPVATYTAADPEMTEIVSWSLGGTDLGAFDISNGVLTFKKSPDYEMAADMGMDNMYEVTVQATDSTMKTGMKKVMVEVADVDEMGMVTLSARMPQREVPFTATLTDPDGDPTGITWQWAKSRNRSSSYTDIENAESATYTPVDTDRNQYLRATAMYTDDEGSGKSAMAMSDYSARGSRPATQNLTSPVRMRTTEQMGFR